MRISDWSSDVCSSDLRVIHATFIRIIEIESINRHWQPSQTIFGKRVAIFIPKDGRIKISPEGIEVIYILKAQRAVHILHPFTDVTSHIVKAIIVCQITFRLNGNDKIIVPIHLYAFVVTPSTLELVHKNT